jgi:hypothetical protein
MPTSTIEKCEAEGLDWSEMGLDADKVEPVDCRDTPRQTANAKQELEKQYAWVFLGEEGKRINQILIVNVQASGESFAFPLCDLEANKRSRNFEPAKDYAVWFPNR